MKKAKKPKAKLSGWEKTKAIGRKGIMITVSHQEHELLTRVASAGYLKVATYVKFNVLAVARSDEEKLTKYSTEPLSKPTKPKKGK